MGYAHDITLAYEICSNDTSEWSYPQAFTLGNVFSWGQQCLNQSFRYLRITNITETTANINELVFLDENQQSILPINYLTYATVFDENEQLPAAIDYYSNGYFDEIYYTRTAYEFMNGLPTYETTHPPFGKILIALGASIWGTNAFGFRFMGALFGILMLPFLYLLGRNITNSRLLGFATSFLFAFDFMHYTQTRLTTIDVFITFFVILMYYFMNQYCSHSFYDSKLMHTFFPLGACGIAFGFGIASKWTGAYAGIGLALLFFWQLKIRYTEYKYAKETPTLITNGISHSDIIKNFTTLTWKTIGFCILFFIIIPFLLYTLSYIPFVEPSLGSDSKNLFTKMLLNQKYMLYYHSTLDATHPYSSLWYEWPTMIRPIFYYSKIGLDTIRQGISAFGNPLIWWAGIPCFFYMLYLLISKHDKNAAFICISYFAQYLPWCFISRCTFIYHYFPSVPFVVLMIIYSLKQLENFTTPKIFRTILILYCIATFCLFLLFYPVLTGTETTTEFVNTFLKWQTSWALIQ